MVNRRSGDGSHGLPDPPSSRRLPVRYFDVIQRLRSLLPFWRFAFSAAMVVVAGLALLPQDELPAVDLSDKLAHGIAFFGLAGLGVLAFPGKRSARLCALGLLLFGAAIEAAQSLIPGREPSGLDMMANTGGIILGFAAASVLAHGLLGLRGRPVAPPVRKTADR
jgi:VanZ family protein